MLDDGAQPEMPLADGARRAGRPSRDDAERLYARIIETARIAFCEAGYAGTSIDKIARDAGTMRRSVMHRFPSKEALLIAVADQAIGTAVDTFMAPPPENDEPLAHIRSVCHRLLLHSTSAEGASLFRVYSAEAGRIPALSDLAIRYNNDLERRIEQLILSAQKNGAFQRFSASAVATAMIGMMLSNPLNRRILGDEQFVDPHRIDLYFSQMWAILLMMS